MKILHKSGKLGFVTGGIFSASLLATVLTPQQAQAIIVFEIFQSGPDVVVSTTGGTLDLTGLTAGGGSTTFNRAVVFGGAPSLSPPLEIGAGTQYSTAGTRTNFAGVFTITPSGSWTNGTTVTGGITSDLGTGLVSTTATQLRLNTDGILGNTYTNAPFSFTIGGQTLAGLGLTEGSFVTSSWNGGGTGREVTLNVQGVPLESDALPVVVSGLFMAGGLWWKRKRNSTVLHTGEGDKLSS